MFKNLCLNGRRMEEDMLTKASPFNGLYIAGATVVCLLCMLTDVFVGFYRRKRWFPCRFFSLNSLTLTIVTVATKIPLDRTTIMHTAQDQLSKLTGTSMICICMGFFMPSLGTMRPSECFANMASLSVLVISVVFSICTQIRAGMIIPLFVAHHVAIVSLMLVLLVVLWFSAIKIIHEKKYSSDHHDKLLTSTPGSLLNRLKYCYVYSYVFNPQLILCRTSNVITVAILCFGSSLVLLEAVLRSFFLGGTKCGVDKTVELSMSILVVTQMVFIFLGGLATYYRILISLYHLNVIPSLKHLRIEVEHLNLQFIFYRGNIFQILQRIGTILVLVVHVFANCILAGPSYVLTCFAEFVRNFLVKTGAVREMDITELKLVFESYSIREKDWILKKGVADFERWIKVNEQKSLKQLSDFLSSNCSGVSGACDVGGSDGYNVSCLSMAMFAMYAENPISNYNSIVKTLDQAFRIIYFIDKNTTEAKHESRRKRKFTKEVWSGGKFTRKSKCCDKFTWKSKCCDSWGNQTPTLPVELKTSSSFNFVSTEIRFIKNLIEKPNPEQVLAYMIRGFLAKLPSAIYKYVIESQPEDYEKRVKRAIKFICKLKLADNQNQIPWNWEKFPSGTTMGTMMEIENQEV